MKGTSKRGLGYRHLILLMVWLLYLINYMDRTSVLTFLPYIGKDLHLSAAQLGWLGSIFFAGYALAQVSAGFVADKFGPKKTMNIAIWMFTWRYLPDRIGPQFRGSPLPGPFSRHRYFMARYGRLQ